MSEGVFAVHRGVFKHEMFANEKYSEREAWLWLVGNAVWRPCRVRVGRKGLAALERGQLAYSERFLAECWQWPKTKVRRFLARLQDEHMIDIKPDQLANRITICNYDRYAFDGTTNRTTSGPEADQKRTKEEELNNIHDDDDDGSRVTPKANRLSDEIAKACGHDPEFIPPSWFGAPYRAQQWLNQGWPEEIILLSVREQIAKKRDGPPSRIEYFEKGIASAIARQSAPLPAAQTQGRQHGNAKTGSGLAAIDRIFDQLEGRSDVSSSADENALLGLPARSISGS